MMTNDETAKYNELIASLGEAPDGKKVAGEMVKEILTSANKQTQGLMALFGITKKAWETSESMQENIEPGDLLETVIQAVRLCGADLKIKNVKAALKNCEQIDEIAEAVYGTDGPCNCDEEHES